MSLPEFPKIDPPITREDAINQIISSIAMEELGLSHIINAEGEKLQYVLGTIPGISGPAATIDDVLKVNESIRNVLQGAAETQSLLRSKLQSVLSASTMAGPTGPTGPSGPSGPGAILPFASGMSMNLLTETDGKPAAATPVGFGAMGDEIAFNSENLNISGGPDLSVNFAIAVPRAGAITSFTARFSTTEALDLTGITGTVYARLYRSENATSNVFEPLTSVEMKLEPGNYPAGTVFTGGGSGLNIPVTPDSSLMLAFHAGTEGATQEVDIKGYGSASLVIS